MNPEAGLDRARLVPAEARIGGHVARTGRVVALIGPSDDRAPVDAVLALCRDADEHGPDEIVTRLSALAADGHVPDMCIVAASPRGDASTIVVTTGRTQVRQGRDSVTAFIGDTAPEVHAEADAELVDLRAGVVAADGFVLLLDPESGRSSAGPAPPSPEPVAIDPIAVTGDEPAVPAEGGGGGAGSRVSVVGVSCGRGHFNDPRARYCAVCGLAMVQSSHVAVRGHRPTLGVLVFETGEAVPVRSDLVIGRAPETHERVRADEAVALVPRGDTRKLSRVHAEVRVGGWDVDLVDCGSTNGTFVQAAGDTTWHRLGPGETFRMSPGVRIAFGQQQALFESQVRTDLPPGGPRS